MAAGFLENLDRDAWPKEGWGALGDACKAMKKKRKTVKKKQKVVATCPTKVLVLPPSNSERRARVRKEAEVVLALEATEAAANDVEGMHPLLLNATLPRHSPMPPSGAPPRGRPRIRAVGRGIEDEDEDGSWGGATSFFGGGSRRRPREDWPRPAISERWGITGERPLA